MAADDDENAPDKLLRYVALESLSVPAIETDRLSEILKAATASSSLEELMRSKPPYLETLDSLAVPALESDRLTDLLQAAEPSSALEELMRPAYLEALEAVSVPAIDTKVHGLLDFLAAQPQLTNAALGPVEDLRPLGMFDNLPTSDPHYAHISEIVERAQEQFRLPELGEAAHLAAHVAQLTETWKGIELPEALGLASLEAAMMEMRSPWLDIERTLESARGFAALQTIGSVLDRFDGFEDSVAAQLRRHLGDWRDSIVWPADVEDIDVRSALYTERGLDTSMTGFPAPAFRQSIIVARLDSPSSRVIELKDYEVAGETDEERAAFERTHAAQRRLLYFEYHLRRFIDRQMIAAFGENWADTQVDDETRGRWRYKQQAALDKGERPHALIDYADFTDYERVIFKKDNWKAVFQHVFRKRESVQESLQRLHPVRICSYHARLITQDDELMLYVEVKRILKAMGVVEA